MLLRDADEGRARDLAGRIGGEAVDADGLPDAAARARTVVLMLPDSSAVEAVLSGGTGLLALLAPGSMVLDMSSSRPASTVTLAAAARERGVALVDAPVSGGVARAREGALAVMVGGSDQAFQRVRPLLEVLGEQITHVGDVGAGHAMKALNNLLSAIGLAAASEVLAVGSNFGLSPQVCSTC